MKKTLYILCCAALVCGCNDFLERTPIAGVGSNNFFTSENALTLYTNNFLVNYTPSAADMGYGDGYSDIVATEHSTSFLYMSTYTPSNQTGWSYSDWNIFYNVNYFLDHFREVPDLDEETYNHYEGTARFWRAYGYWNKVKTFGAVPWYDSVIDAYDEEGLYKDRDSREYVMDKVLEDLDFACENLLTTSDWVNGVTIDRYIALAMKAKICLFEGTYRKYHQVDPSTGQPWEDSGASERFLRACTEACEDLMATGAYKLVDDGTDEGRRTQYRALFNSLDLDRTEILWGRECSVGLNTAHQLTYKFTSPTWGERWSLDQDFVQSYLHTDGSRHYEKIAERQAAGENVTLTTEAFADEVADRDYRLQQQIVTPGYVKVIGGADSLFSPSFNTSLTGYQPIKWNIDNSDAESGTTSENDISVLRYAEVLLSYAEAKCELGEMNDNVWDQTIRPLRERSGVDGRRRSDIDPYLADYYGGLTDPDLVEVRRERAIEMLLENTRYDDLMRWHLGELLNKTWYGTYIAALDTPYDVDGNGSYDIFVSEGKPSVPDGITVLTTINMKNTDFSLEDGDHGRLVWNCDRYFDEARYLHPVPQTAIEVNNNLTQNHYWDTEQ